MPLKMVPSGLNGLTFVEDALNDDIHLVLDTKKFKLNPDQVFGISTVTLPIPFPILRDYVLKRIRDEEIKVLQSLEGEELYNYYVGLGQKNAPL